MRIKIEMEKDEFSDPPGSPESYALEDYVHDPDEFMDLVNEFLLDVFPETRGSRAILEEEEDYDE